MPEAIFIKCMYMVETGHLGGIKKVSDVIKNAQNRKLYKARYCLVTSV